MEKIDPKNLLADVPDLGRAFWFHNGTSARNIGEFEDALSRIDHETFCHHVNEQKNDFYNWIKEVIKDDTLARKIKEEKEHRKIALAVKNRIRVLKKKIK